MGGPQLLGICAGHPIPCRRPAPPVLRICPWCGGHFSCPLCAALGWLGAMGILWVLILLCTTSPGCPLCAISCHCFPHQSWGKLVCHCASYCSVLSLAINYPVTGTFLGFPASVLYTVLCEPHHPFSLCPLGHSRSGVTSLGTPGPSQR